MLKKYGGIVLIGAFALVFWLGQQSGRGTNGTEMPATESIQTAPVAIPAQAPSPISDTANSVKGLPDYLPAEAKTTLELVASNGPFPHRQDGAIFQTREKRLPQKPRGYYHEYTVETPGLKHRGARRIITGGDPVEMYFYTDDHYDSFRKFEVPP